MISLVKELPKLFSNSAEAVKINCRYSLYNDIALFWVQNDDDAVISMLDGNMVICNKNADIGELYEFIKVISPLSVFSDAKTLSMLFGNDFHTVSVMKTDEKFKVGEKSDTLNSAEVYRLLNVDGLQLPPYETFAVDFCYRLNHGQLKYFGIKNIGVAVGICDGQAMLVNGIASHKKGMGSLLLKSLISNFDTVSFAVCEPDVMPFYLKNNFIYTYSAGYWRKNN